MSTSAVQTRAKRARASGPQAKVQRVDGFSGFPPGALEFLRQLAKNNSKTWFEKERDRYQSQLVEPAKLFVAALQPALSRLQPDLRVEPRVNGSIYRINRDVRFSKDKRPYKEELAFRFLAQGDKGEVSGIHMRIRPDLVGIGAGMWGFQPAALARYREAVADAKTGTKLQKLIDGYTLNGCGFGGDSYKRVPKPWPEEHPRAELLKLKGLFIGRDMEVPKELHGGEFVDWCVAHFRPFLPLHRWLSSHVTSGP